MADRHEDTAPPTLYCDAGRASCDLAAVEVFVRMKLAARRAGRPFLLDHASTEQLQLLAFLGLEDVLLD